MGGSRLAVNVKLPAALEPCPRTNVADGFGACQFRIAPAVDRDAANSNWVAVAGVDEPAFCRCVVEPHAYHAPSTLQERLLYGRQCDDSGTQLRVTPPGDIRCRARHDDIRLHALTLQERAVRVAHVERRDAQQAAVG